MKSETTFARRSEVEINPFWLVASFPGNRQKTVF